MLPTIVSILKRIFNTSNITNNITRHKHNNFEHNVITKGT